MVLGIGLCVALYLVFTPAPAENQEVSVPTGSAALDGNESNQEDVAIQSVESSAPPADVSMESLGDLSRLSSDFERIQSVYSLLAQVDKRRLLSLLEESVSVDKSVRPIIQQALVHRLTTIDPQGALTQARNLEGTETDELLKSIFSYWARVDLDEAIAESKTLDPHEIRAAMRGIFVSQREMSDADRLKIGQSLGQHEFAESWNTTLKAEEYARNPEESWYEVVDRAQGDSTQITLLNTIAKAWFRKDGLVVIDRIIESTTNQRALAVVLHSVFQLAVQSNPRNALERALQLENDPWDSIVGSVANAWAQSDPKRALEVIQRLAPENKRQRLLENTMQTWASREDPLVMLEALAGMDKEMQELGTPGALSMLATKSPKEAANLIGRVVDVGEKRHIASQIVWSWSQREPTEALHWVLNDPHTEPFRHELMSSTLANLADEDPGLAMSVALAQPAEETEVGLEFFVISTLASVDVGQALEFLPQARNSKTRMYAYSTVGMQMAAGGNGDEALELGENIGEGDRELYYRMLAFSWTSTDPDGLLESIDKFPSDESKSKAAAILTLMGKMTSGLKDEQIEKASKYLLQEDIEELEKGGMGLLNMGEMMELMNM